MSNYLLGSVFYSTNLNPDDNAPVGLVNHLCIWVGNGQIVESQEDLDGKSGVLLSSFEEYKNRKIQWNVLFPLDKAAGERAAEFAKTLVGRRYGKLSSIRRRTNEHTRRLNCTSVIALSYSHALECDIKLSVPDEIFKRADIFSDNIENVK